MLSNKTVYAMGSNEYGQLGSADFQQSNQPVALRIQDAESICCGADSSYCVSRDGAILSWGRNHHSQLGYKSGNQSQPRVVPIAAKVSQISAGDSHAALLTQDSKVYTWGSNQKG